MWSDPTPRNNKKQRTLWVGSSFAAKKKNKKGAGSRGEQVEEKSPMHGCSEEGWSCVVLY